MHALKRFAFLCAALVSLSAYAAPQVTVVASTELIHLRQISAWHQSEMRDSQSIAFVVDSEPDMVSVIDGISVQVQAPPNSTVAAIFGTYFVPFVYQGLVGNWAVYVANLGTRIVSPAAGVQQTIMLTVTVDSSRSPDPRFKDAATVSAFVRGFYIPGP
jgi:hypothetical protein